VGRTDILIDHVVVGTYSVLTRLPAPRRVPPHLVTAFLTAHDPTATPRLAGGGSAEVLEVAERPGITGGAVYDLMVALAAKRADATLLSLDRRAASTYAVAGVRYELLSG
jgi:hypothetical protein